MGTFDLQLTLLKCCGLTKLSSLRLNVASKVFIVWNYCATIFWISSSVYFVMTTKDVLGLSENMAPTFAVLYSTVKYIVFCLYGDQFYEIMDKIELLNMKWSLQKCHDEILSKANALSKKITLALTFGSCFAGVFYGMKPILNELIKCWIYGHQRSYELPFKTGYFYNVKSFPAYELTFIIQMALAYYVVLVTAAVGGLFCCYCFNIVAHFEILRDIVNDVELKEFVDYHRQIIDITKRLSELFKSIIFIEFSFVNIILCVTGLQVIIVDDFGVVFACALHAIACLIDVAIFSYASQKIMDSALSVSDEVYKIDKKYIFVILIAQKELKFDTGLFDASLDTLSIILSRTMSFITLLKSFVT